MMTAEPLPSPADSMPSFKAAYADGKVRLDYRTRDCSPFLRDGRYFDSFEHAMQIERYVLGTGPGVPTERELSEENERKRIELVSKHQEGGD